MRGQGAQYKMILDWREAVAWGGRQTGPGSFTRRDRVSCLGTCGLAPVMGVDEDIHNQVKEAGLKRLVEAYQDGSIQSQR